MTAICDDENKTRIKTTVHFWVDGYIDSTMPPHDKEKRKTVYKPSSN
jgi:hypothetical protein